MKYTTFLMTALISILFTSTACSQTNRVKGSNHYITQKVKVKDFSGIKVSGSPDVIYTQTRGKYEVEIYAPDNIVPLLETFVEGNSLVVRFKKNTSITHRGRIEVRVSAPAIDHVHVSGSGSVEFASGLKSDKDLSLKVSGSGDIEGRNIRCANLDIQISGSGDVDLEDITSTNVRMSVSGSGDGKLSGVAETANYRVSGSGEIKATELRSRTVDASVSGSGEIYCHAIDFLKARVSGSGEISYKGNPEIDFPKKGLRKIK